MNYYTSTLIYLMKFYNLPYITIYDEENHQDMGKVKIENGKLVYDHKYRGRYYTHDEYAFQLAESQIGTIMDAFDKFKKNEPITITAIYEDRSLHHSREESWNGNLCDVMEKLYSKNHSLAYCPGCSWKFETEEMNFLYKLWHYWLGITKQELSVYMRNGGDMW